MEAPTFASLYSGAGGLDVGFMLAGFRPVFANDIDPDAVETYNRTLNRFSRLLPHVSSGHEALPGDIGGLRRRVIEQAPDLIVGGPPCQGFSVAGRMDPNDPRSQHVWEFLAFVDEIRPEAFVMENVKALAQNRRWSELLNRLRAFASEIGYSTSVYVLDAANFGVPQARERMFLVGLKNGLPHHIPNPTSQVDRPTVQAALESFPRWGAAGNDSVCTAKITPAPRPVLRRSPFAGMLFNGKGRPLNINVPAPTLHASMGGNATPILDQHQLDNGDECWVVEYHRRLLAGGKPLRKAPPRLRRLTVEEAAAIQGFPRRTDWAGSLTSRFRQIGNAVPPPLGLAIGKAVRKSLAVRPYTAPTNALETAPN